VRVVNLNVNGLRAGARERDVGWRLDLRLATPGLAARATAFAIPRRPVVSGHAPVAVDDRDRPGPRSGPGEAA